MRRNMYSAKSAPSIIVGLLVLFSVISLSSGAKAAGTAQQPALPGMDKMEAQMAQDTAKLKTLSGKDFEVAYMQMMIPHHQSAVEMAQMVAGKAVHPELTSLAQSIISSQQQEIGEMQTWLKDWYGISNPTIVPMAGMDQSMPAMQQLTGADFERAFLMMMPMHHQGAVNMSVLAPGRATHPELLQLAQSIVTSQKQEIGQMSSWAMSWYNFDPTAMSMPMSSPTPMPMGQGGDASLPSTGGGQDALIAWEVLGAVVLGVLLVTVGGALRWGVYRR